MRTAALLATILLPLLLDSCVSAEGGHAEARLTVIVNGSEVVLTQNELYQIHLKGSGYQCINLRGGPGMEHPSIVVIEDGAIVEVTGRPISNQDTQWIPVAVRRQAGVYNGFMAARFLSRLESSSSHHNQ